MRTYWGTTNIPCTCCSPGAVKLIECPCCACLNQFGIGNCAQVIRLTLQARAGDTIYLGHDNTVAAASGWTIKAPACCPSTPREWNWGEIGGSIKAKDVYVIGAAACDKADWEITIR